MPELHEPSLSRRTGLAELRAWYLEGLRPKLSRAAGAGTVPPAAAEALDQRLREFLDLPSVREEEAA
jgi:hypothetical protein